MLEIKKPIAKGDVVAIRAATGEEIIGRFVSTDTDFDTTTITQPIVVQIQMMQEGPAISFAPYTLARDEKDNFTFYNRSLVGPVAAAREDIRVNYLKATTSLDVPPQSSLIL